MKRIDRIRVFPLLVLMASFAFMVRAGDFVSGFEQSGVAFAQHDVQSEMSGAEFMHKNNPVDTHDDSKVGEVEYENKEVAHNAEEWMDSIDAEFENSEVKESLYRDLSKRRQDIKARERALDTRKALLNAGEREIEQKLRELIAIRNEIEELLKEQSEEQKAKIISLVKIYEGMKAKDAARIFNTLDIDVLLEVISKMSVRKSGPILAEMSPERARTVTILLARKRQLSSIAR